MRACLPSVCRPEVMQKAQPSVCASQYVVCVQHPCGVSCPSDPHDTVSWGAAAVRGYERPPAHCIHVVGSHA